MERRGVDMVRLEQPEEVYDVEELLGRDAASVFPSMNKQLDPMEQLKAAMGAKRFVTETELEQIKAARGLTVDDGTAAADKPLAEILAERKKAKQDAFEQQWKDMKTGKNRPLDADELQFLDTLAQQEATQQRAVEQQEQEELDAFRQAVAAAAAAKEAAAAKVAAHLALEAGTDAPVAADTDTAGGLGPSSAALKRSGSEASKAAAVKPTSKPALPVLKPIVKVKPRAAAVQQGSTSSSTSKHHAANTDPSSKRQRVEAEKQQPSQQPQQDAPSGVGLVCLLGGYGSGSDDDS